MAIIGIISAIAVPGVLRARQAANEAQAIADIRAVMTAELRQFYADNYPDVANANAASIDAAAIALGDIYASNVFPRMEVWWDTYPNHIGHTQSAGCERCHTRRMRTAEREQIDSECETCHVLLAEEEEDPQILSVLSGQ